MRLPQRTGDSHAVAASPFRILSLSGGGYRGLFTAIVLDELESRLNGRPIGDCFDMVAGTSIGGIIACGLAVGLRASEIRQAFERSGPAVFDTRVEILGRKLFPMPRRGILGTRYSRMGLEAAILDVLGDRSSISLKAVRRHLIVPAVSATSGRTVLFESDVFSGPHATTTLKDVALATSAAPTYFPEHAIGDEALIDGGVVANAPDLIAITKAMTCHGRHVGELRMLSIGTAAGTTGELYRPGRASGSLRWILARNLFGLTVAAQQALSLDLSREILGNGLVRIDAVPDPAKASVTVMDRADEAATRALRAMGVDAVRRVDQSRKADLDAILRT